MKKSGNLPKKRQKQYIFKFSEMWYRQNYKLVGHLLRADKDDPLHQVVFRNEEKQPRLINSRRSGQPRERWLIEPMTDAFNIITGFIDGLDF